MDGRRASFSEADPLLSRAQRLLVGSIDGAGRVESTCNEDLLSQHGAPSLDWRVITPLPLADAEAAIVPIVPPLSQPTRLRPPIELHRIAVIMCAYGLFYTLLAGNQTVAALAAISLDVNPAYATVPIAAMFIGAILTCVPAAYLMHRKGRRVGLSVGGAFGVLSGVLGYFALENRSFPLLIGSGFCLGIFDGFSDFLRFAASEAVSSHPQFQGSAVSIALSGGALCSVVGPQLGTVSDQGGGFQVYYAIAIGVACLFILCVQGVSPELPLLPAADSFTRGERSDDSFFDSTPSHSSQATSDSRTGSREGSHLHKQPRKQQQLSLASEASAEKQEALLGEHTRRTVEEGEGDPLPSLSTATQVTPPPRSVLQLLRVPEIAVAIVCGMAAQWIMVLFMTGLPLAMVDTDGFAFASYANTIQAHLVAMFLPGVGSGYCADRWGPLPILLVGGVIVAVAILFGRDGNQLWNFTACLTAVGAGWNFLAVGSTKLLLASHTKEEAAPIEAAYEMAAFLANGGAAIVAGWAVTHGGWQFTLLSAVPVLVAALIAILLLAVRSVVMSRYGEANTRRKALAARHQSGSEMSRETYEPPS